MPSDLSEIKERWKKATPGPWRACEPPDQCDVLIGTDPEADGIFAALYGASKHLADDDAEAIAHAPSDIAALLLHITELDALVDEECQKGISLKGDLYDARERITELEDALRVYGVHKHACEYSYGASDHCTCGFRLALKEDTDAQDG